MGTALRQLFAITMISFDANASEKVDRCVTFGKNNNMETEKAPEEAIKLLEPIAHGIRNLDPQSNIDIEYVPIEDPANDRNRNRCEEICDKFNKLLIKEKERNQSCLKKCWNAIMDSDY